MKKMLNIRNSVIVILCITIICMAMGFIVLSVKLEKATKDTKQFDISFISSSVSSLTKGGKIDPTSDLKISNNGKELDINFVLSTPHDQVSYTVLIRNDGTIPATIVDLLESPDYKDIRFSKLIDPVTITYNDIIGKELEPGEETELNITAYYNPSTITGKKNITYKIGLIAAAK